MDCVEPIYIGKTIGGKAVKVYDKPEVFQPEDNLPNRFAHYLSEQYESKKYDYITHNVNYLRLGRFYKDNEDNLYYNFTAYQTELYDYFPEARPRMKCKRPVVAKPVPELKIEEKPSVPVEKVKKGKKENAWSKVSMPRLKGETMEQWLERRVEAMPSPKA